MIAHSPSKNGLSTLCFVAWAIHPPRVSLSKIGSKTSTGVTNVAVATIPQNVLSLDQTRIHLTLKWGKWNDEAKPPEHQIEVPWTILVVEGEPYFQRLTGAISWGDMMKVKINQHEMNLARPEACMQLTWVCIRQFPAAEYPEERTLIRTFKWVLMQWHTTTRWMECSKSHG